MAFIILMGIVSLFADMTYEGARSISGQYLAILGASGTVVGIVAGLGEFIGYGFRLISGYLSDKTGKYWLITFIGYIINLFAVPLLALAGNWPLAATFMVLERFGKSIRTPAKDAMLSYATKTTGRGWGFGLHEAMDQTGAIIGPLIVSAILYYKGTYQTSFAVLLIPALCAMSVLVLARILYPQPKDLEIGHTNLQTEGLSHKYRLYLVAICLIGLGYVDFALIAYHFEKAKVVSAAWVPVIFSIAMASAGLSAIVFGRLYDKMGIASLISAVALSSLFVLFVFLDGFYFALIGMVLWGIGIGAQESVMRAVIADMVPTDRRGTAYGTMNFWFGLFWFLGSAFIGYLYDISIPALIAFSLISQLLALPVLISLKRK